MDVNPWFWVWVALAAILLLTEAFSRDLYMLPFALGAATAALLEFLGVDISWQWIAFLGISSVLTVAFRRWLNARSRRLTQ